MRQGQNNKRMRGRGGGRKGGNPRNQSFESNGPEVRVRGNPQQIVEKYLALARDASSAGDRINAESYYQFAEHYYRIMNANAAAAEQQRQAHNPVQDGEADASNNADGADVAENAEKAAAAGEDGQKAANSQNGRSRRRNNRDNGRGDGRNSQVAEDGADQMQPDVTEAEEAPSEDTGDSANA
jgi:hypothetical protein